MFNIIYYLNFYPINVNILDWGILVNFLWFIVPIYFLTLFFFFFLKINRYSTCNLTIRSGADSLELKYRIYLTVLFYYIYIYCLILLPSISLFFSHILITPGLFYFFFFELVLLIILLSTGLGSFAKISNSITEDILYILYVSLPSLFLLLLASSNFYTFIFIFEFITIIFFFFLIIYLIKTNALNFLLSSMTIFWLNAISSLLLFTLLLVVIGNAVNLEWYWLQLQLNFQISLNIFIYLLWIFLFLKLALPPLHLWKLYIFTKIPFNFLFIYLFLYFILVFIYFIILIKEFLIHFFETPVLTIFIWYLYFAFLWIILYSFTQTSQLRWGSFVAMSSILTSLTLLILIFICSNNLIIHQISLLFTDILYLIYIYVFIYMFLNVYLMYVFVSQNILYFNSIYIVGTALLFKNAKWLPDSTLRLNLILYFIIIAGLPPTSLFFIKLHLISILNYSFYNTFILWISFFFLMLFYYYTNVKFLFVPNTSTFQINLKSKNLYNKFIMQKFILNSKEVTFLIYTRNLSFALNKIYIFMLLTLLLNFNLFIYTDILLLFNYLF